MNHSQSCTDESKTTSTDSNKDQDESDSCTNSSRKRLNKDLYKIPSEQTIVHRWFLSDIKSLNNQEESYYVQSNSFGCTGENTFLQWIIHFYPKALSSTKYKTLQRGISNIEQLTINEEESSIDDKSYCAFEILKIDEHESSSQTLFETIYQIFEIADDGILSLLKTEGRHQVHFNRAFIIFPHDIIFSISSNNILFSIKLIIYEYSSTIGYYQSIFPTESYLPNVSNLSIEFSIGKRFWLMSMQKILTDLILCSSDDQEFHVHRLIVYTSCKKILDMNQESNRIEIHSVNGRILEKILKYIYTNEIEICIGEFSIDEFCDLLNAVDVFELFQLKNILIKKCLNHITEKNCFDLLKIADEKQMTILKNRILLFLCQQCSQLLNTDLWKQFCTNKPHLSNEIFANLLRHNQFQKSIIEKFDH